MGFPHDYIIYRYASVCMFCCTAMFPILLFYHYVNFLYPHRVFSAFIKEVDGKTNTDTIWGKKSSFGSCLSEFSNGRGILDK